MPSKTIIPKRMREDRSAWTGRDELIVGMLDIVTKGVLAD